MWSIQNLLSEAEAAKERIASVIAQQPKGSPPQPQPQPQPQSGEGMISDASSDREKANAKTNNRNDNHNDHNDNKNCNNDHPQPQSFPSSSSSTTSFQKLFQPTIASIPNKNDQVLSALKSTWTSALTATKVVTQQAMENLEKEQTRIQARLFQPLSGASGRRTYIRDLSLPLDTESLRDAEVVYITDRLITMGHPAIQSHVDGDITSERKLAAVQHLLQKRHGGKYMIWNLSELEYDYSIFDNQVMTFEFPGSPSPPLGLLMKILLSLESWLKADEKNVAVMHCLTGRGRTSTVMSAFLCWIGEASFGDPNRALEYMAQCKKLDLETLTIPSQRRYVGYFKNMMDGVRPNQPPLLLKRIILSEAPKFEKYQIKTSAPPNNGDANDSNTHHDDPLAEHAGKLGCAPYLQIFKAGKLVYTAAASKSFNQAKDELPFCFEFEKSITFPMETVVQGDILIRCRHLTRKGQRVSMFRAALHTGYVPPKILRLRKSDIDGACSDKRYSDDFFMDLVFEECSASMASKHLLSSPEDGAEEFEDYASYYTMKHDVKGEMKDNGKTTVGSDGDTVGSRSNNATKITASAYDSMLHRDSRFWDMIAKRRKEKMQQPSLSHGDSNNDNVPNPFYGPTIGRRREFSHETSTSVKDGSGVGNVSISSHRSEIHAFTIGGELDFTPGTGVKNSDRINTQDATLVKEGVKTQDTPKDDLMDALMAIDDDVDDEVIHDESEEVVVNTHESQVSTDGVDEPNDDEIATEEIVFYSASSVDKVGSNQVDVVKGEMLPETEAALAVQEPESPKIESSVQPSARNDLNNMDDKNTAREEDKADAKNVEDADNLSDEDDELADLEEFLLKLSG